MKKIFILGVVTTGFFASCAKTYNCSCTETYSGETNYTNVVETEISGKKKDAEATCIAGDSEQTILTETKTVVCELK